MVVVVTIIIPLASFPPGAPKDVLLFARLFTNLFPFPAHNSPVRGHWATSPLELGKQELRGSR